jgi:predicted permease
MMETLVQDLRYAARRLLRSPGFTAVAILSLALGIGANTTIFSFVNALFLQPLPVKDPHEVVAVFTSDYSGPLYGGSSFPDYVDFRTRTDVFAGLAAFTIAPISFSDGSRTDRVFAELVSANYFEVAGVAAGRGRLLRAAEDGQPASAPVLVLSHGLWQRRFGGDPGVIGRQFAVNGQPFTVVGIAPARFKGLMRGMAVDLWVPLTAPAAASPARLKSRGSRWLFTLGRLKQGVSLEDAQARLSVLAAQLRQSFPDNWTDVRKNTRVITVLPESGARFMPAARGAVLGFFSLLLAVVALVVLMACTNIASMLLARAAARRRETAIRLSLGASRTRLIRQLLTESLLLSLVAGAAGVLLALWATDLLMAFRPPVPFPFELPLTIDARVLGLTLLVSTLTGLAFGLVPALQASRPDMVPALKDEAAAGGAASSWSPRQLLIVAQVALSLVLLVGAGLFVQSLRNAHRIDLGFEPRNLLLVSIDPALVGYKAEARPELYRRILERTRALPGVLSASLSTHVPLGLSGQRRGISIEGYEPDAGEDMEVNTYSVGPGYLATMGIPLARGREFEESDARVVVVNEAFVRRYWPRADALGKRISLAGPDSPPSEVVGVARDAKYKMLGEDPLPFFYVPVGQIRSNDSVTLHVRTASDPARLAAAVRRELRAVDASLPVFDVTTMTDHLGIALLPARLAGGLLGGFGFAALLLAAVGIYGVMANSVSRRTREMGVRIALGARAADLLSMVIRQGMRLAAAGLAIGLLLALGATRLLGSLLYGVSASDPLTFTLVPALLCATAFLACYIPAHRAARVDAMIALRNE